MSKSIRDNILNNKKISLKKINVPEWGGDVYIKELTVREQAQYENGAFEDGKIKSDFYARYLIKALCDENGENILSDADFDTLANTSANTLLKVWTLAKEAKEEEKNSEADQLNTSPTN